MPKPPKIGLEDPLRKRGFEARYEEDTNTVMLSGRGFSPHQMSGKFHHELLHSVIDQFAGPEASVGLDNLYYNTEGNVDVRPKNVYGSGVYLSRKRLRELG